MLRAHMDEPHPRLKSADPSIPLEILYQDQWLAVIHKPAGHLVHPTETPQPDDLVSMKILRDQIEERVYSIHRLDRPTAGVLLFGIDREASKLLHKNLAEKEMQKTYWAIIKGKPTQQQWDCHASIQKHETAPVRDAHTSFTCLKTFQHSSGTELSLIEATPHTGRFHQIRRHLLEAGHPIVGDYRYAGIEACDSDGELLGTGTRMLLLAKSLELEHPVTGETLKIETTDPLFQKLLDE